MRGGGDGLPAPPRGGPLNPAFGEKEKRLFAGMMEAGDFGAPGMVHRRIELPPNP